MRARLPRAVDRRVAGVAGVERRRGRHGEQVTRPGVHHDQGAAARSGLLHLAGERALRDPLDVAVDGQRDVLARDGVALGGLPGGNAPATCPAFEGHLAVGAGQHVVQGVLQPAQALAVRADEADQVGPDGAGGVGPPARLLAEDARQPVGGLPVPVGGQVQRADLPPHLRGDRLGHVGEAVGPGQRAFELVRVSSQQRREHPRGRGRVDDQRLVGSDVHGVDGGGEGDPVAVGDRAAGRRQLDGAQPALGRLVGVRRRVQALQLHQPAAEQGHHDGEHDDRAAQPSTGVREPQPGGGTASGVAAAVPGRAGRGTPGGLTTTRPRRALDRSRRACGHRRAVVGGRRRRRVLRLRLRRLRHGAVVVGDCHRRLRLGRRRDAGLGLAEDAAVRGTDESRVLAAHHAELVGPGSQPLRCGQRRDLLLQAPARGR